MRHIVAKVPVNDFISYISFPVLTQSFCFVRVSPGLVLLLLLPQHCYHVTPA